MTANGLGLSGSGSIEGWFYWQRGAVLLRDSTSASTGGWILAWDNGGTLYYRVAGKSFSTGRSANTYKNAWHHFVLTKSSGRVTLYIDGSAVHSSKSAPTTAAPCRPLPWRATTRSVGAADRARLLRSSLGGEDDLPPAGRPVGVGRLQPRTADAPGCAAYAKPSNLDFAAVEGHADERDAAPIGRPGRLFGVVRRRSSNQPVRARAVGPHDVHRPGAAWFLALEGDSPTVGRPGRREFLSGRPRDSPKPSSARKNRVEVPARHAPPAGEDDGISTG